MDKNIDLDNININFLLTINNMDTGFLLTINNGNLNLF